MWTQRCVLYLHVSPREQHTCRNCCNEKKSVWLEKTAARKWEIVRNVLVIEFWTTNSRQQKGPCTPRKLKEVRPVPKRPHRVRAGHYLHHSIKHVKKYTLFAHIAKESTCCEKNSVRFAVVWLVLSQRTSFWIGEIVITNTNTIHIHWFAYSKLCNIEVLCRYISEKNVQWRAGVSLETGFALQGCRQAVRVTHL